MPNVDTFVHLAVCRNGHTDTLQLSAAIEKHLEKEKKILRQIKSCKEVLLQTVFTGIIILFFMTLHFRFHNTKSDEDIKVKGSRFIKNTWVNFTHVMQVIICIKKELFLQ